ncbi:putative ATLS1-like light-inducible protein [Prochlorococcus marinus str. SS35]|nr:putative ATLS1-like light-inducible protein [Prochlorococcus marinus str. SS35]
MTLMQTNVPMTFAGTNAPCCYVEIKSIGAITPAKMTAAFCEIISKNTTIPTNRIYIAFEDVSPDSWGWDGRVFG